MEAAVEYQTKTTKEFVVPQEWIDEAERVSKAIDNGEMKTYSSEEFVAATKEYFKTKHNVNYTPNIWKKLKVATLIY